MEGPLLFLRYAFMPNRLGYCGGEDHLALLEYGVHGQADQGLIELEQQFEGAYPYLRLIARANDVADPLDARVVEAYWVGNALLDRVDVGSLYASLEERFKSRTRGKDWPWLASKVPAGARPHHSFHVLEVYPRIGLMRSGAVDHVVQTMGQCLIRWGRVVAVTGSELLVEATPLAVQDGKLTLAGPHAETVTWQLNGRKLLPAVTTNDWVSIHWGWACDVLTPAQRANLERYTRWNLALCNRTV